jgi:hypothetical protein
VGIGKFGEAAYAPCSSFPSLLWCAAPSPPKLAPYDSPRVGGGHTQAEYCEPKAEAYRPQYPDYEIHWKASEASDKDLIGHVTYVYHCEFFATPKPRRSSGFAFAAITLTGGLAILGFIWWRRRSRTM